MERHEYSDALERHEYSDALEILISYLLMNSVIQKMLFSFYIASMRFCSDLLCELLRSLYSHIAHSVCLLYTLYFCK